MRTSTDIKAVVDAGLGRTPCDLRLENLRLVNAFTSEIISTDIHITAGRIISIHPGTKLEARKVRDCRGLFALPGFIDTHMHFETTLLTPEALGDVILPTGTTTLCMDAMEIANVSGIAGLRELLKSVSALPYRAYMEVSSRVPTAPGLETTGGVLGLKEVEELLDWEESLSLGEIDPSKILIYGGEYFEKIAAAHARGKIVNGHAIGRFGKELNVYASAGISDDHECVEYEELLERIRLGMAVLIREGSSERNVDKLITGVLEKGLSTERLMFCTDDKHVNDILREGHINYNVNRSIELGMKPLEAIRMATINAARHFRVEGEVGSLTPGRLADVLLVDNLEKIEPAEVFFEGRLVAREGRVVEPARPPEYPEWILNTVILKEPVTPETFAVKAAGGKASADAVSPGAADSAIPRVILIDLVKDQIINTRGEADLPVSGGLIQNDVDGDILKLSVVERYGKTGGVGTAFVRGFKLTSGALASSVSHDHHNIVCVGTNDKDMSLAVNAVADMQGGFAAAENGKIVGKLALPVCGLMSTEPVDRVIAAADEINAAARSMGCEMDAPFMSLSFISLPTVPDLGLTDMGLVDVMEHRIIELEITESHQ